MPGTAKSIQSPYGNRPSSLPNPVPAAGEQQDIESLFANTPPPQMPAQPQTPPAADTGAPAPDQNAIDALFGGPASASASAPEAPTDAPQPNAPQPGDQFASENSGFGPAGDMIMAQVNQFRDLTTRFQAGLAANDNEVMGLLKKKFGDENVRWKDDKAWYRQPGEKQFRPLDPKAFEIFSDLIPDMSRGFVQEAVALPAELGGGAIGGPVGATVGRVASVPAQIAASDYIAEKAGVPQDPSRSKVMEMGVQAALEASMPIVGKVIGRMVPGTTAYNAAKEAGEKELTALSKQSQVVAQSVNELAQMDKAVTIDGQLVGVPGAQVNLGAHQLNPESPKIQALQKKATEYAPFNNAMRQHAEDWGNLFEKTMTEVASRGTDKRVVKPGELANTVVDAVANVRKIEGDNIAKYKMQAMKKLGDRSLPLIDEVKQPLGDMMQVMNFNPQGGPVKQEELQQLVGKYGITSIGEARAIVNNVRDVMGSMQKDGGMKLQDMDRLRNSIGDLSDRMRGTPAGRQLAILASGLRENYKRAVAAGIDNEFEKVGFMSAMDDYSQIMNNIDTLRNALNEDSSATAIVNKFFTGKDNIEKVRAIKALSPESFDQLKAEWVNQQLMKFRSRENPTGFNATAMLDKIQKQYGPEFMNEVFPKEDQRTIVNFLNVMERIDKTFQGPMLDQASDKTKQGAINTLIGIVGNIKFKTINGITALFSNQSGPEKAAIQLLSRDGIDKYVAAYPGKDVNKKEIAEKLKQLVATYRINRIIDSPMIGEAGRIIGKQRNFAADKNYTPMAPDANQE